MLLRKFLILFFGLPALRLCGSAAACPQPDWGSQHLYCRNIMQQCLRVCKPVIKHVAIVCCMLLLFKTTRAQVDSNYVDTISMHHINTVTDTVVVSKNNEASSGYNDEDDGYVDTTEKHIYDTSQYFFDRKDYYDAPFTKEKIVQRHLIDSAIDALKKDKDFWYIPAIEKLELRLKNDPKFRDSLLNAHNRELTDGSKGSIFYQSWFNILLWIIIIGVFIAAVVYFLIQNKIGVFSKESASSADENANDEHEDIFNLSYTKLIQAAEKQKDYRVAIRLMFLQTLKLLSDTNAIQYKPDYTDLHYLQQLHQSKYYGEFFSVMRSYEYAWFGKFYIPNERYITIRNDFLKLQQKVT